MKSFLIFGAVCVAIAVATPINIVEDSDGEMYYLVPLHRERRQTTFDVNKNGPGAQVTIGHKGTILDNGNHRLDGGAFASKNFKPSGPLTVGGNLGYQHSSGSGLNVGASNTRGFGTDVNASGNLNLINRNHGNTRLDAVGQYGRHFGGPGGSGRPTSYGGLQFSHRF